QNLHRVLDITRAMAATHELDELLPLIIERSLELLEVERATLFLYQQETNQLVARIATGMDDLCVPADKGICGETLRQQQTLVINDAYSSDCFNPEIDRATGFRTRNIMSVPLLDYEGSLVGVLQMLNKRDGDFTDQDVALADMLAAQSGVVLQRARLIEHYLEKQKMQRAMQIARDIQQGLLPDAPPDIDGYDIAGLSDPADETGGDMFDFITMESGAEALVVADATGHGIGPALVIAEMRAMLRASIHLSTDKSADVSKMLETVNYLLAADLSSASFVTCFLGVMNPTANSLTYASAGHGPIIIYDYDADSFREEPATGLPLGVLDDADYDATETVNFKPGDMVIVTTDGFFEAADTSGEMFGTERMHEIIRQHRDDPVADIINTLQTRVMEFCHGIPQADDLTAIAVKRQR
ncbi:MAG: SpoIIE family protein phosphatase, partial [Phycisphaerae bacterium]|nr:SpoIIE family protein phosphatase [Phycisphaerae bacterium]